MQGQELALEQALAQALALALAQAQVLALELVRELVDLHWDRYPQTQTSNGNIWKLRMFHILCVVSSQAKEES